LNYWRRNEVEWDRFHAPNDLVPFWIRKNPCRSKTGTVITRMDFLDHGRDFFQDGWFLRLEMKKVEGEIWIVAWRIR